MSNSMSSNSQSKPYTHKTIKSQSHTIQHILRKMHFCNFCSSNLCRILRYEYTIYIYRYTHYTHACQDHRHITQNISLPSLCCGDFRQLLYILSTFQNKTNKKPPLFQSTILSIRPEDLRSNNNKSLCNWRKYEFFFFLSLLSNCFIYFD